MSQVIGDFPMNAVQPGWDHPFGEDMAYRLRGMGGDNVASPTGNVPKFGEIGKGPLGIPGIDPHAQSLAAINMNAIMRANIQTKTEREKPNTASGQVYGIDPQDEQAVTGLGGKMLEGEYLQEGDYDQVVIGYFLLSQYVLIDSPNFSALKNVGVGDKIRVTVGGATREVKIKGIVLSKVDNVRRGIYMTDTQLKSLIGSDTGDVGEIAIRLTPEADPISVKESLLRLGVGDLAKVQTYEDAQPQFLKDIVQTFNMLGNAFSSIGLIVSSITIFIVIFINALTRRKFIGILKGIGINGRVIETSYVFQSVFYALIGSGIGLAVVYGFLVPYFAENPINFPFSDGILVAPFDETMVRIGLLVASTVIAGYIPASMIVRKNTLDSILGRK
jgi:ABC-type lipoprotein release transport system permease subunit